MKWIIAVLIFSLLVVVHEFGHFLAAKMNGVEVEEFSVGFGPRILSTRPVPGKTRYSLKLLLFGGSCRMKGMSELLDELEDGTIPEPDPHSFRGVSVGRRASIIFAGPLFNFILAWVCAVIVLSVVGYDPAYVINVAKGSLAEEAGLRPGDLVTRFNGEKVEIGRDVDNWFIFNDLTKDTQIKVEYIRDGEKHEASFLPTPSNRYMLGFSYMVDDENALITSVSVGSPMENAGVRAGDIITAINGNEVTTAKSLNEYITEHPLTADVVVLTLTRNGRAFEAEVTPVNGNVSLGFDVNLGRVSAKPSKVMKYSFVELRYWITTTIRSVGSMFTGRFTVDDLSGPVGVVDIVGETYEGTKDEGPLMTWMNMLNLIILLSANLGVMNLLPIPAIDGGKLLFLIIEAVRGKPMNANAEAAIQTVAAVLLLMLMVYVMYHDITMMLP